MSSFAQSTLESQLGLRVPWLLIAVIVLALNSALAYFAVDLAAKVLGVLLVGEVAILIAMAVSVLVHGGGPDGIPAAPINPVNAFQGVDPGFGLFFAFWSWVGFESTAMYGEESRDPKRIIPIATIVSVVGIGLLYVFVSWMAVSGNGLQQSVEIAQHDPFGLIFNPLGQFVGQWAVHVAAWLMITGSFACGLAFHNCASRYLYAIGREGIVAVRLGRTHRIHRSPYIASLVQTGFAATVVLLFAAFGQDPYSSLYSLTAVLGTGMILIVQVACSFAVVVYFHRRRPEARHWFRTLVAPLVGGVAMTVVVALLFVNLGAAAGAAAGTPFFRAIPWLIAGTAALGVLLALYLRARRPEIYARVGRIVLADAVERAGRPEPESPAEAPVAD
ncbi:APC family permease [Nocardia sp. NPDC127579]|uniref:APC family permease n=1 Tax=Nocardia sp. NPDC127579 TaxID=3345402 RepID=UPI0036431E1F